MKSTRTWFKEAGSRQPASGSFFNGLNFLQRNVWPFIKTGKSTLLRREGNDWAQRLEDEKKSLRSLVDVMEVEFVAMSKGLMRLGEQLSHTQTQCQSLTDLTLGAKEDAAVQFSFQLLKKVEDLLLATYDQYDHVFAAFRELQRWLSHLPKQHDELLRVLLPLNIITTAFRIEASRRPAEVQEIFTSLATAVNRMVTEVRGTLECQFEELAASEQIVRSLMEQVSASIQSQRTEASSTLESSRHQLRVLGQALASSGAGAVNLAQQNRAITRHIGNIVMALQCQDITSQKIAHVSEAMDGMRIHLEEAEAGDSAAVSDPRQFVFRAAQIQLHQVQDVFDQLKGAADSLKSGMQSLRTESGTAAEAAVKVGSTALNANVARQSQARISAMLTIIKQALGKIGDILAAFESLQSRFVNCSKGAAVLAIDVRYAALNAQIFAVHARDGATLEVLAGRMRIISDETILQVERMGASLCQTDEMINNLRERLADFQSLGQAEQQVLIDESVISQKKLSDLESGIPALIGSITEQQETFAQAVDRVLANVRFPEAVAEAHSRSIGFFQELVSWGGEGVSDTVANEASRKIDLLKSHYTMESERQAHAAALGSARATPGATLSQPAIEMFDELAPEPPPVAISGQEVPLSNEDLEPQASAIGSAVEAPAAAEPLAPEKPAAAEDLGANVELF